MKYFLAILALSIFFSHSVFAREIKNEDLEKMKAAIKERTELLRAQWPVIATESREKVSLPESKSNQSSDLKDKFNQERERFINYAADLRKNLSEDSESKIEELRARNQQFLEAHRDEIASKREEARKRLEEIKSKRVENLRSIQSNFRDRLKSLSNQEKEERLVNFLERINNLNDFLTDKYLERLSTIEVVLDKMELRAQILEVANRDVSEALASVAAARELVAESRILVLSQKEKTYVVAGDDLSERAFVSILTQFRKDHSDLRADAIRPIFSAISEVLEDLKSARIGPILKEDDLEAEIEKNNQEPQNSDDNQDNANGSINN